MTISSDMIKITLVNDILGQYDIPFAVLSARSVATQVENWSRIEVSPPTLFTLLGLIYLFSTL
jgi:hypothetical protein